MNEEKPRRKIGFRIDPECIGVEGPAVIPVDLETGQDLDGVTKASVECGCGEITTLTMTVYVQDKDGFVINQEME